MSSGGAIFIIESLESALRRDANILGEVLSGSKKIDGIHPTRMDVKSAAKAVYRTIQDEKTLELHKPDAIFGHFTATDGDSVEAQVYFEVMREYLKDIPITAIKSMLGHALGGAGALTIMSALKAIQHGAIPPVLNLENPDEEFSNMMLVRNEPYRARLNKALAFAAGFGSFNAGVLIGAFNE